MTKQILCVHVHFIYTAGVKLHLSCRFEYRLQVPGEHCASCCTDVGNIPAAKVVMANESCLALLLRGKL